MNDQFPFFGQGFSNTLRTTVKGNMGGPNTGSIYIYNSIAQLDPDSYKKQSIVFLIGVWGIVGAYFFKGVFGTIDFFPSFFNREQHKLHGSRNCFHMISKHIDMEDVFFLYTNAMKSTERSPELSPKNYYIFGGNLWHKSNLR